MPRGASQLAGAGITTGMAPRLGYINTVHVGKFRRANRLPTKRANCDVKWSQPRVLQVFAGAPALRSEPRTETVLSAYDLRVGFTNHFRVADHAEIIE
jgi:hypothetical protein